MSYCAGRRNLLGGGLPKKNVPTVLGLRTGYVVTDEHEEPSYGGRSGKGTVTHSTTHNAFYEDQL